MRDKSPGKTRPDYNRKTSRRRRTTPLPEVDPGSFGDEAFQLWGGRCIREAMNVGNCPAYVQAGRGQSEDLREAGALFKKQRIFKTC